MILLRPTKTYFKGPHRSVDYSLELLDNVLDRDIKLFLFPIIEDLPPEEKTRRLKKLAMSLDQRLGIAEIRVAGGAI